MRDKVMFSDKRFNIGQPYIGLLIIIFTAALFSKGAVIYRGFAVDDYVLMTGNSSADLGVYYSQGRFIAAAIVWAIHIIGANINDMYFALGIVTLILQSAIVVSIIRFVGMEKLPAAGLVGAIMVAHPYLTEILTFRMALPAYCIAMIFTIIALEVVTKNPATWRTRAFALLATLAMLFTYQVFLNYIAVAIVFAYFLGQVLHKKNDQTSSIDNVYRERALTLTIISSISVFIFLAVLWLSKVLHLTTGEGRTNVIAFDEIPQRIMQIASALQNIYLHGEPVLPRGLKYLVALMLVMSIIIIFKNLLAKKSKETSKYAISDVILTIFMFLMIIPISLGVIIPFENWYPVPRVIAHVAIIIGLIFLLADSFIEVAGSRYLKLILSVLRIIVLVGFVFLSNQILADQQRINQWDRMMANRIISRLETQPNFSNVRFVHINGGVWGFPANLRTVEGDMNISAFYHTWSKVPLLTDVTGYRFEKAYGPKAAIGEKYCHDRKPWPDVESISIEQDLAIICLKQ